MPVKLWTPDTYMVNPNDATEDDALYVAYWEHKAAVAKLEKYEKALKAIVSIFEGEDYELLDFLNIAEGALK